MKPEELGFDQWFRERLAAPLPSGLEIARVAAVNRDNYAIRNEAAEVPAELTGRLLYGSRTGFDLPVVGDWVYVQYFNENTLGIIHDILPRKSLLKRKKAGKKIEYQLIAANIDVAFIVQSLNLDFNLPRLERYLIMSNDSNIKPVILLSKCDLISTKERDKKIAAVEKTNAGYEIIAFSNKTGKGLEAIRSSIEKGKTYCLLGSSGVGKTTLINKLLGKDIFTTEPIRRNDDKGRHATARRQLIILDQGGLIIDTPGMRELGNIGVGNGLRSTFSDIASLAQHCRFKDCTHTEEPDCAVIKAAENGDLPTTRYQNYLKIRKESEFHEMSYLEKRKKDKKFGKMVKDTMKNREKA